jgi:signal transduction histidine kinase
LARARSALAAWRARVVVADDAGRRRVVRDLHDGAQQRLVHNGDHAQPGGSRVEKHAEDVPALVGEALAQAERANAELRELPHGIIMPAELTVGGSRGGIEALASRMPVPVDIGVSVDRPPPSIEAAAYCTSSRPKLTNVAKHASATRAQVMARVEDGALLLDVLDDGCGGARADGSGLLGLADRLAVVDGRLVVHDRAPEHVSRPRSRCDDPAASR